MEQGRDGAEKGWSREGMEQRRDEAEKGWSRGTGGAKEAYEIKS